MTRRDYPPEFRRPIAGMRSSIICLIRLQSFGSLLYSMGPEELAADPASDRPSTEHTELEASRAKTTRWLGDDRSGIVLSILSGLLALGLACGDSERTWLAGAGSPADSATAPGAAQDTHTSPNVILITIDTLRADALGAYGQTRPTSPNLDRLASEGVLFEQVSASAPETLPSHATIFTGLQPFSHGVRGNSGYRLGDEQKTLAEVLEGAGYITGAEVAAPVVNRKTQITQGFTHYRGADSADVKLKWVPLADGRTAKQDIRIASDITDRGIEFARRSSGKPFFLWLHYFDPHHPQYPPVRHKATVPDSLYHAEVAYVDAEIGRLVGALEERQQGRRTLVVVTADHGEGLGDHGEETHAYLVYESTMRVPLIMWGLDVLPKGRRIRTPLGTVDIAPTILELLGLPALPGADGQSFAGWLASDAPMDSRRLYGEANSLRRMFDVTTIRMLREGRWKYIHKVNPELYDLETDPLEASNRIASEAEIARRLREGLDALLARATSSQGSAVGITAERAEALAALGYLDVGDASVIDDDLARDGLHGRDPNDLILEVGAISIVGGDVASGQFERALPALAEYRARYPENTYLLDLHIRALLGLKRHDDLLPLLTAAVDSRPEALKYRVPMADVLLTLGDYDRAAEVLRDTQALAACDAPIAMRLETALRKTGQLAELAAMLGQFVSGCAADINVTNNYAWLLSTAPDASLRDGPAAEKMIRQLLVGSPNPNPAILDTLAAAIAENGRYEEAEELMAKVVSELQARGAQRKIVAALQEHQTVYREGRPVRDPATP